MDFYKKITLLRQVREDYSNCLKEVSGIFRIEIEGGLCRVYLSLVNLKKTDDGEYHLALVDGDGKIFIESLGNRPVSFFKALDTLPEIRNGFSCGILHICSFGVFVVAFGSDKNLLTLEGFKRAIDKKAQAIKKQLTKVVTKYTEEIFQDDYDDEAVATENYYDLDEEINKRLEIIKENDEKLFNENGTVTSEDGKQEKSEEDTAYPSFENGDFIKEQEFNQDNPYYLHAKKELEDILDKFPVDQRLSSTFPESKFVRINYSSDKYYIVGTISFKGKIKYICYGVPSSYSPTPPKELEGYCSFIPLSIFESGGDGFYMMFQDAITGECIKKLN